MLNNFFLQPWRSGPVWGAGDGEGGGDGEAPAAVDAVTGPSGNISLDATAAAASPASPEAPAVDVDTIGVDVGGGTVPTVSYDPVSKTTSVVDMPVKGPVTTESFAPALVSGVAKQTAAGLTPKEIVDAGSTSVNKTGATSLIGFGPGQVDPNLATALVEQVVDAPGPEDNRPFIEKAADVLANIGMNITGNQPVDGKSNFNVPLPLSMKIAGILDDGKVPEVKLSPEQIAKYDNTPFLNAAIDQSQSILTQGGADVLGQLDRVGVIDSSAYNPDFLEARLRDMSKEQVKDKEQNLDLLAISDPEKYQDLKKSLGDGGSLLTKAQFASPTLATTIGPAFIPGVGPYLAAGMGAVQTIGEINQGIEQGINNAYANGTLQNLPAFQEAEQNAINSGVDKGPFSDAAAKQDVLNQAKYDSGATLAGGAVGAVGGGVTGKIATGGLNKAIASGLAKVGLKGTAATVALPVIGGALAGGEEFVQEGFLEAGPEALANLELTGNLSGGENFDVLRTLPEAFEQGQVGSVLGAGAGSVGTGINSLTGSNTTLDNTILGSTTNQQGAPNVESVSQVSGFGTDVGSDTTSGFDVSPVTEAANINSLPSLPNFDSTLTAPVVQTVTNQAPVVDTSGPALLSSPQVQSSGVATLSGPALAEQTMGAPVSRSDTQQAQLSLPGINLDLAPVVETTSSGAPVIQTNVGSLPVVNQQTGSNFVAPSLSQLGTGVNFTPPSLSTPVVATDSTINVDQTPSVAPVTGPALAEQMMGAPVKSSQGIPGQGLDNFGQSGVDPRTLSSPALAEQTMGAPIASSLNATLTATDIISQEVAQTGALSADTAISVANQTGLSMTEIANIAEAEMSAPISTAQGPSTEVIVAPTTEVVSTPTQETAVEPRLNTIVIEDPSTEVRVPSTSLVPAGNVVNLDQTIEGSTFTPSTSTMQGSTGTTSTQTTSGIASIPTTQFIDSSVLPEDFAEREQDTSLLGEAVEEEVLDDEDFDYREDPPAEGLDEEEEDTPPFTCPDGYETKKVNGNWTCVKPNTNTEAVFVRPRIAPYYQPVKLSRRQ